MKDVQFPNFPNCVLGGKCSKYKGLGSVYKHVIHEKMNPSESATYSFPYVIEWVMIINQRLRLWNTVESRYLARR